jgi:hypothetical protein
MLVKITKKNPGPADPASPNGRAPQSERPGWDPFEVWRTRVLLPRLEGDQDQGKPTSPVQLVRK